MAEPEQVTKFTQSMAAAFFDLTPDAFRQKEAKGNFVSIDGENVTPPRKTDNVGYQHRKYSLYDIRRIAHALRANNKISDRQLKIIIMRIDSFSEPIFIRNRKNLYKIYKEKNA